MVLLCADPVYRLLYTMIIVIMYSASAVERATHETLNEFPNVDLWSSMPPVQSASQKPIQSDGSQD